MDNIVVKKTGPIFTGRAAAEVGKFLQDAKQEVAQVGVNDVKIRLRSVLQHPTGYYESRIQTDRQANDVVVDDGRVIYGPWLEGTGSRNRTTRFKGYSTFRIVTQTLQKKAMTIAESVLRKHLGRMQ